MQEFETRSALADRVLFYTGRIFHGKLSLYPVILRSGATSRLCQSPPPKQHGCGSRIAAEGYDGLENPAQGKNSFACKGFFAKLSVTGHKALFLLIS